MNYRKSDKGFTLIEVFLSVALITVLTGMALTLYQPFQVKNDLEVAVNTIAQTLRRAQQLSRSVAHDTSWGVKIAGGQIILFKGIDFALRDLDFDELFDLGASLTPSGPNEIVFTKFSGLPQTTGVITLTTNTSETKTLTINVKGLIDY